MSTRGRRRILIVFETGFIGMTLPSGAVAQRCGYVSVPARGSAKVRVVRGTLHCRAARRQIAAPYQTEDTRHWSWLSEPLRRVLARRRLALRHRLAGSQTFCHRGAREVDGSLRSDDGWTF
jgi:hypothetical protein